MRVLAARFTAVEINTSFYRIPSTDSVGAWQELTPSNFKFAIKMWRGITHYRKLLRTEDLLSRFFAVADRFTALHRGPLLVQLPPNQSKDLERLETFLKKLREASPHRWKVAVEFRHDSWLTPDVYRLLDKQRAAICLHDREGSGAAAEPNNVSLVYVRRHGPSGGHYQGSYTEQQLRRDAARVCNWQREGRQVYVFFNNDVGGHAFRNAEELRKLTKPSGGNRATAQAAHSREWAGSRSSTMSGQR